MLSENLKYKILIAEDDYYSYLFIKILLRSKYFIEWARDGQTALDLFAKNHYDLVIMDYRMPRISGIEATKAIRKSNSSVPIIAQTAYDIVQNQLISAGCNLVLIKPFKKIALYNAIKTYLPE